MDIQLESGSKISTYVQISPPGDLQIQAQTNKSGGSKDGGNIHSVSIRDVLEVLGYTAVNVSEKKKRQRRKVVEVQ